MTKQIFFVFSFYFLLHKLHHLPCTRPPDFVAFQRFFTVLLATAPSSSSRASFLLGHPRRFRVNISGGHTSLSLYWIKRLLLTAKSFCALTACLRRPKPSPPCFTATTWPPSKSSSMQVAQTCLSLASPAIGIRF